MIVVGSREESACMEREGQALHDQGRKNGNSLPFFFLGMGWVLEVARWEKDGDMLAII